MSQVDRFDLGTLVGHELGTHTTRYEERDAILYALAVGATASELDLVYEERLQVLPTFALTFGLWALDVVAQAGGYDRRDTLHVGQELEIRRPLPPRGRVVTTATVESVWDKGSAALLVVLVASEYFQARYTIFVKGAGGFGGDRGPRAETAAAPGQPDARASVPTGRDQAVLYRLTGDLQPVHIDPDVAHRAGFDRPIFHGLATLGCVALAMCRVLDIPPTAPTNIGVRFAAPVFPGTTLDLSLWRTDDGVDFVAAADDVDVLTGGRARFGAVSRT